MTQITLLVLLVIEVTQTALAAWGMHVSYRQYAFSEERRIRNQQQLAPSSDQLIDRIRAARELDRFRFHRLYFLKGLALLTFAAVVYAVVQYYGLPPRPTPTGVGRTLQVAMAIMFVLKQAANLRGTTIIIGQTMRDQAERREVKDILAAEERRDADVRDVAAKLAVTVQQQHEDLSKAIQANADRSNKAYEEASTAIHVANNSNKKLAENNQQILTLTSELREERRAPPPDSPMAIETHETVTEIGGRMRKVEGKIDAARILALGDTEVPDSPMAVDTNDRVKEIQAQVVTNTSDIAHQAETIAAVTDGEAEAQRRAIAERLEDHRRGGGGN